MQLLTRQILASCPCWNSLFYTVVKDPSVWKKMWPLLLLATLFFNINAHCHLLTIHSKWCAHLFPINHCSHHHSPAPIVHTCLFCNSLFFPLNSAAIWSAEGELALCLPTHAYCFLHCFTAVAFKSALSLPPSPSFSLKCTIQRGRGRLFQALEVLSCHLHCRSSPLPWFDWERVIKWEKISFYPCLLLLTGQEALFKGTF